MKLADKPMEGFDYAGERWGITEKLLNFKDENNEQAFKAVFGFEVKDDVVTCKVRTTPRFYKYGSAGVEQEKAVYNILTQLQKHFGIGAGRKQSEARRKELEGKNQIPLAYFTDFKKEKTDEA